MTTFFRSKRGIALIVSIIVATAVLVACGGGGSGETSTDAAVQNVERAQAQGLLDKLPVSWSQSSLTFNLNPGGRQDIAVTLTSTKALTNAKIVFVPDLKNAVTVTPDTIAALPAGQSATVTLTFAPAATDTRKVIAGILLLFDKNATTSKPLLVKVSLVAPEAINGVTVPPEPPTDLNNATLAGFDTNGNGVRDDVERLIASEFGSNANKYQDILTFAKSEQLAINFPTTQNISAANQALTCSRLTANELDKATNVLLNTPSRRRAYGDTFAGSVFRIGGCK